MDALTSHTLTKNSGKKREKKNKISDLQEILKSVGSERFKEMLFYVFILFFKFKFIYSLYIQIVAPPPLLPLPLSSVYLPSPSPQKKRARPTNQLLKIEHVKSFQD